MIPSVWRAAAKWYYAGMWSDHFIPTAKAYQSERFGQGGVFNTGRLALMPNGSWFTWVDSDTNWDVAAMPSFQGGKPISFVSGNGFAIMKGSKHPQESFEVLALLMSTYEMDLMDYLGTGANARGLFYGGLPARLSLHSAIVERNQGNWPDVDWQVFLDAQKYETYPGGFMYLPNHKNAVEVYGKFQSRYESTPGLDIESELTKLQSELQSAFDLTTPSS
jgi:multiple sugar transport system substrate-binding protein